MNYPVTLTSRRSVALNTTEVTLTLLPGSPFTFTAGQHLDLLIHKPPYTDELGSSRTLSIASTPAQLPEIKLAYRESASAFKRSLATLSLGTELEIKGPFGSFTLFPPENQETLFIAGGIGITPFLSILRTNPSAGGRLLTLLYANHGPETAAYLDELKKFPIKLVECYGRPDKETFRQVLVELKNPLVYIAGPSGLTAAGLVHLTSLGVPRTQILTEEFTGY